MGDIIDLRADRFLRAMRATGSWDQACAESGLSYNEAEDIFKNPELDLAQVEAQLEYINHKLHTALADMIDKAERDLAQKLAKLREEAMGYYRDRHV
jgi:molybdenum-dependent DNA-binding transcriptional regulator ModE